MGRPPARALFAAVLLAMATGNVAARGDDAAVNDRARALFEEGRGALARKDFELACARFRASLALVRSAGTLGNLGQCDERDRHLVAAAAEWKEAITLLPKGDERVAPMTRRLEDLERRIPHLTLRLAEPRTGGARATVDGRPLAGFDNPVALDPGEHEVAVTLDDGKERRIHVVLAEGQSKDVVVAETLTERSRPRPGSATEATTTASGRRTAGYVVGAVGVASIGVGLVTGGLALAKKNEIKDACPAGAQACPHATIADAKRAADEGRAFSTVSTITVIAGGAALALGAVLVLTAGPGRPAAAVGVGAAPSGARVEASIRF